MLKNKKIYMIPVIGFCVMILFFSGLLMLPCCVNGEMKFLDSLFISSSAISGTGFSTVVVSEKFTVIGQIILLLAVQIGALGFLMFFSALLSLRKKKMKLSDTVVLSGEINFNGYSKVKEKAFQIIRYAFGWEFLGFMLLAIYFIPEYRYFKGVVVWIISFGFWICKCGI